MFSFENNERFRLGGFVKVSMVCVVRLWIHSQISRSQSYGIQQQQKGDAPRTRFIAAAAGLPYFLLSPFLGEKKNTRTIFRLGV